MMLSNTQPRLARRNVLRTKINPNICKRFYTTTNRYNSFKSSAKVMIIAFRSICGGQWMGRTRRILVC
uniref:Uncharacterized protein n=1 Tax=Ciona intestinalis TaxID=7719 RepID=F6R157_CIOIN